MYSFKQMLQISILDTVTTFSAIPPSGINFIWVQLLLHPNN